MHVDMLHFMCTLILCDYVENNGNVGQIEGAVCFFLGGGGKLSHLGGLRPPPPPPPPPPPLDETQHIIGHDPT